MNYDLLSAYTERETNRLVEEDKAVQKKIADNAIAKVMATGNEINANLDNAVATAYRQNGRTAQGLKSETSQIGNQALTERLVRNINQNRDNINTNLDNIKLGIDAQIAQNNVKTDREYLLPQAERELEIKVAQAEQDKAIKEAQQTKKQQEGFLEQLNELSRQSGYDYDFDADIFALKQQGYKDSDWQIQFLKEANRLQKRNAKKASSSGGEISSPIGDNLVSPNNAGEFTFVGAGGTPTTNETTDEEIAKIQYQNYVNMANGLSQYQDISSNANLRRTIQDSIMDANEAGAIDDDQATALLQACGLI